MVSLSDVVSFLDRLLRVKELGEDTGLIISGEEDVEIVCGAVNLSFNSIEQAIDRDCNLLFTHHAAWKSTDADLVEVKHSRIRDAGMSWYVSHDPLDLHPEVGTAISLARVLNWEVKKFFCDGLGVLAKPGETTSLDALRLQIAEGINPNVQIWKQRETIDLVGIIAGWGARPEWMQLAREEGADTFLSGEAIHFGKLYAQEAKMNLLLAGHYATELPGVQSVLDRVDRENDVETVTLFDQASADLF